MRRETDGLGACPELVGIGGTLSALCVPVEPALWGVPVVLGCPWLSEKVTLAWGLPIFGEAVGGLDIGGFG